MIKLSVPAVRYTPRAEERRNLEIEQADRQNWKHTGHVNHPHGLTIGSSDRDTNVTQGLTVHQGANTDSIVTLKNSDVAHAMALFGETDTFLQIQRYADTGGFAMRGIAEDDAGASTPVEITAVGGQAETTKTSSTKGLVDLVGMEHDGAGGLANVTADGAVLTVRCRRGGGNTTLAIIDEDGDLWLDGGLTLGGFVHVSVTTAITASVTQTQGQQALTTESNLVETVANANDVVTLPAAVAGRGCEVVNAGANTLQIFPASGDAIDGGAADASVSLAAGDGLRVRAFDATDWYPV